MELGGVNDAGADGVDGDAMRTERNRGGTDKIDDAGFAHAVVGCDGVGAAARNGGDGDQATAATPVNEPSCNAFEADIDTERVDSLSGTPLLSGHLEKWIDGCDAGAGDRGGDRPKLSIHELQGQVDRVRLFHIDRGGRRSPPSSDDPGRHARGHLLGQVSNTHCCAFSGQAKGECYPDSATTPCDKDYLVGEPVPAPPRGRAGHASSSSYLVTSTVRPVSAEA